mmetsp:Transcript_39770/g.78383  ORF Transcript_39770/g.78383 Transcript_39770/m.78383 type:complete len:261 (+) Transcript_39770:1047-1829(+)
MTVSACAGSAKSFMGPESSSLPLYTNDSHSFCFSSVSWIIRSESIIANSASKYSFNLFSSGIPGKGGGRTFNSMRFVRVFLFTTSSSTSSNSSAGLAAAPSVGASAAAAAGASPAGAALASSILASADASAPSAGAAAVASPFMVASPCASVEGGAAAGSSFFALGTFFFTFTFSSYSSSSIAVALSTVNTPWMLTVVRTLIFRFEPSARRSNWMWYVPRFWSSSFTFLKAVTSKDSALLKETVLITFMQSCLLNRTEDF